jgi:uncharacterized membrane protein
VIEFAYKPAWYSWLAASLLIVSIVGWSYFSARGPANPGLRIALSCLRFLVLGAVLLCLLDPQRVEEIRHYHPAHVAVMVDTSRSMAWKDDRQSRLDDVRDWLKQEFKPPSTLSVSYYGFNTNSFPLSDMKDARPDGSRTALADSLENLAASTASDPPASIILLSDGSDNSLKDPTAIAKTFGQRHIPIHTVTVGTPREPPDIIVENIHVARAFLNQSTAKAVITLRSSGFEGQTVPLRIVKDSKVLAATKVKLAGGSQRVELEFAPTMPGFQTFLVEVPEQSGERLLSNNRREFGMTVVDLVLRVIYMEASGVQKGVFQPLYLKHALEDTPGIEVKTLYVDQYGTPPSLFNQLAYIDPKNGDKIYRVQNSTNGYPRTLDELLKYHVVIFSDVNKTDFTPEQLEATERFVTEFGGGFIMVGGHTSFGAGGYQNTIIDNLIPVAMERESDLTENYFVPRVPDTAWTHPLMRLGATETENREIWTTKFPQLEGYNRVDRAKPGATVLLEHPSDRTSYRPAIILAAQEVGRGRTMALTTDTTYLWGEWFETIWGEKINPNLPLTENNCDSRYFKQFWVNSVRWLSAHKLDPDQDQLAMQVGEVYCATNLDIPVRVRAARAGGQPTAEAEVTLHLSDASRDVQTARAVYSEEQQGYLANVRLPATGKFILRATAKFKDGKTVEDKQLLVGEELDQEMADLRARPETLAALSRSSGGQTFSLRGNDPRKMAEALTGAEPESIEFRKTPLWDKSWWLGSIVGLLTIEWVLRRQRGMA